MEIEVVLGLHRRSEPDSYTVRVPVDEVILNSKYDSAMSPWASPWATSDIMLLKLQHIPSSSTMRCLQSAFRRSSKSCRLTNRATPAAGDGYPVCIYMKHLPLSNFLKSILHAPLPVQMCILLVY